MPDEPRYIRIGQDIIAKYCTTYQVQKRVRKVAATVAKQYCLGFAAAMNYARLASEGFDAALVRDAIRESPKPAREPAKP